MAAAEKRAQLKAERDTLCRQCVAEQGSPRAELEAALRRAEPETTASRRLGHLLCNFWRIDRKNPYQSTICGFFDGVKIVELQSLAACGSVRDYHQIWHERYDCS
ncbi:hypothetical protein [Cupriavidus sp. CuC1]|uniref:hypothetical protein n=1 Tax=Cupriavidus sp. CuC1 TaxID=3373131 RepID=UPI0037CDF649